MIYNLFVLGAFLAVVYIWATKGFFNAFLHMVCTVAAGAIAFGVWEAVSFAILGIAPTKGFLSVLEGLAWPAGLVLPFALSLLVLRIVSDLAVPSNIKNTAAVNYVGGGLCGVVSGIVTIGILVIAQSFARLPPSQNGYQPVDVTQSRAVGGGSLVRAASLWVPVDTLAAGLYGQLSRSTFRTATPLAEYYPKLELAGWALRGSSDLGRGRNALRPGDYSIVGGWTVGPANGAPVKDLLALPDGTSQGYVTLDDQPVATGRLYGYAVSFGPGAKESNGQVVLSNGSARLLIERTDQPSITDAVHPAAIISQARAENAELYGRWAFDGQGVFIASVGGASTTAMGFEFVVPQGYQPRALVIRNLRQDVAAVKLTDFPTASARTASVQSGRILGTSAKIENVDKSDAVQVRGGSEPSGGASTDSGLEVSNRFGFAFQSTQAGGLELGEGNQVVRGTGRFSSATLQQRGVTIDKNLRVDAFATTSDTRIAQLDVGVESKASLLGKVARSVDQVLPPQLIDTNGAVYQAVGYVYSDREFTEIRYDPGDPIRGLSQLPSLSSSRDDQKLKLIFVVSIGAEIDTYAVGSRAVLDFEPAVPVR